MPKGIVCLTSDQFQCGSSDVRDCQTKSPLPFGSALTFGSADNVKGWDDARCPICMEHPHNAVLLRCSSFEKGCRPFMCNTSYRHSNCLDQFCRSSLSSPSTANLQGNPLGNMAPMQSKLLCPLCRGDIYGWDVVEPARQFMNSKTRNCSCEVCDFSGSYGELRKHARSAHPTARPTDVDIKRQDEWARIKRGMEYGDILSLIQSNVGEESNGESIFLNNLSTFNYFTLDSRSMREVEFEHNREHINILPIRTHHIRGDYPIPSMGRQLNSQGSIRWRHHGSSSGRTLPIGQQSSQIKQGTA